MEHSSRSGVTLKTGPCDREACFHPYGSDRRRDAFPGRTGRQVRVRFSDDTRASGIGGQGFEERAPPCLPFLRGVQSAWESIQSSTASPGSRPAAVRRILSTGRRRHRGGFLDEPGFRCPDRGAFGPGGEDRSVSPFIFRGRGGAWKVLLERAFPDLRGMGARSSERGAEVGFEDFPLRPSSGDPH